jgi:CheY-like chemotaxis protein
MAVLHESCRLYHTGGAVSRTQMGQYTVMGNVQDAWERFREELRDALSCLFDPDFQPSELLYAVTGCETLDGPGAVQSAIIQVIDDMKPGQETPAGDRNRRIHACLDHRFVQGLTQEETAEQLEISVRHFRRVQREATHVLARMLWEHSLAREVSSMPVEREPRPPLGRRAASSSQDWRTQMQEDLASLQMTAPGTIADVRETILEVTELERILTARHGINLVVGDIAPDLSAPIHPSALRQILIVAIGRLVQHMEAGQITVSATLDGNQVRIVVAASHSDWQGLPDVEAVREIVSPLGGSIRAERDSAGPLYLISLPAADKAVVLVVDDNRDLVHFYRRCTVGTRYQVVHLGEGRRIFETVDAVAPDVVVLDIMLPDVDGWKLLSHLHEHPATRAIPVIVCSVIREEELALALGAAAYLAKPVRPRQFTQALDQVLRQTSEEA